MYERSSDRENSPRFTDKEVRDLVDRVKNNGTLSDVDYVDEQLPDRRRPYFYILQVDPAVFQQYIDAHGDLEVITQMTVDYGEERVLDVGEPLEPATLYISVNSVVFSETSPKYTINKKTTYRFWLDATQQATVNEVYSVEGRRLSVDPIDIDASESTGEAAYSTVSHEQLKREVRELTQNDIEFLRPLF